MMAVLHPPNSVMPPALPGKQQQLDRQSSEAGLQKPLVASSTPSDPLLEGSGTLPKSQTSSSATSRLFINTSSKTLTSQTSVKPTLPTSPISNSLSQASTSSQNIRSPSTAASSIVNDNDLPPMSPFKSAAKTQHNLASKADTSNLQESNSRSPSVMSVDSASRISSRARKPTSKALALADAGTKFYRSLQRHSDGTVLNDRHDLHDETTNFDEDSARPITPEPIPQSPNLQTEDAVVASVEQSTPASMVRSSPRRRKPTAKAAAEVGVNPRKRIASPINDSRSAKKAKTSTNAPKHPSKLRKSLSNMEESNGYQPDKPSSLSQAMESPPTTLSSSMQNTLNDNEDKADRPEDQTTSVEQPNPVLLVDVLPSEAHIAKPVKQPQQADLLQEADKLHNNVVAETAVIDSQVSGMSSQLKPAACNLSCLAPAAIIKAFAMYAASDASDGDDDRNDDLDVEMELADDDNVPLADSVLLKMVEMFCSCDKTEKSGKDESQDPPADQYAPTDEAKSTTHRQPPYKVTKSSKSSKSSAGIDRRRPRQSRLPPTDGSNTNRPDLIGQGRFKSMTHAHAEEPRAYLEVDQLKSSPTRDTTQHKQPTEAIAQPKNDVFAESPRKIAILRIGRAAAAVIAQSEKPQPINASVVPHSLLRTEVTPLQGKKARDGRSNTSSIAAKSTKAMGKKMMDTIHVNQKQPTKSPTHKSTSRKIPHTTPAPRNSVGASVGGLNSNYRHSNNTKSEKEQTTLSITKAAEPSDARSANKPSQTNSPSLKITLKVRANPDQNS